MNNDNISTHMTSRQWIEDFEGGSVAEVFVHQGKGGWVTINEGKRVYEGVSGHSCLNLGHAHSELLEAAMAAMSTLSYSSPETLSQYSHQLAGKLCDLLGGDYMVKYALSGASANEVALTIARQYWCSKGNKDKKISLSLERSYHGNMGQAQFVTGYKPFRIAGNDHEDFVHISNDFSAGLPHGDELHQLQVTMQQQILQLGHENIACLFVEPVNFAGGVIVHPVGYLAMLRELCNKYEILLVVDEVITGFGRSGTWFGFQKENIRPDIITMGKGITSGYFPLAAVAVDNKVYRSLRDSNARLKKVITMAGHPVGCNIALKSIDIIEREALCQRVMENEAKFRSAFENLIESPIIKEVRGCGHMWGLEFMAIEDQSSIQVASVVAELCEEAGCIVAASGGVIRVNPPLNMSDEECELMISAMKESVERFTYQVTE